ncbi:MAG: NAD+ synthase [Methanosarcinales archaeon]|nr:NAD+ synthase [Methanosarcinales archaeon]
MDTMPDFNQEETTKKITNFIRAYVKKSGTKGAVIGLSGGIDSAVTTYLAVKALGRENVLAIIMPERSLTPAEDVLDATEVANILNIEFSVVDISETLNSFIMSIPEMVEDDRMSMGNLKARVRMCNLYYYANMMNRIVVGTGNRTELLLGYFTKYGDGGVDIEPLGNLFKTQVQKLAAYLDVPKHIIDKPPSAGLWPGQTDEKELGMTYEEIDNALVALLDQNESLEFVVNRYGIKEPVIAGMLARIERNVHKRRAAPTPPK